MTDEARRIRTERLRWASRRAFLENDLVLQRFWKEQPGALDEKQAEPLERLLELEDHDLWELLSGRSDVADPNLQGMVALLRQTTIQTNMNHHSPGDCHDAKNCHTQR